MRVKFLLGLFILLIISLFFYSFTQVDLGLTLSRVSVYQSVQKIFQHIGYFQRPLSVQIYIGIVSLMFIFYFLFLRLAAKGKITKKQIWIVIFVMSFILTFSYNAFSYDLFNYIFDAKIFTFYHQNPYLHKALDYNGEPMLGFMHWVERTYPYGPSWLGATIPLSFLGNQIFLLTFFLFKGLATASFLVVAYFIGKILRQIAPNKESLGLVLFALNPLVIMESLVSSHNDTLMLALAMGTLYFYLNKLYLRSLILLILSIGVKFATVFMIPALALDIILLRIRRKVSAQTLIILICAFMTLAVIVASLRTNFQPWYLLYVLPFVALVPHKYFIAIPGIILSVSSLAIYVPFLVSGNWNPPIPTQLLWITSAGIGLSFIFVLVVKLKNLLK